MSVNSRLPATKILGQRKPFYRKKIPESSCTRKETGETRQPCNIQEQRQKNHAIYQNNKQTSLENKELEPVQPVQMNTYQSNTYRKVLSWLHFDDEPMVRERRKKKDLQSYISVFVGYPSILSSNQEHQPGMAAVFHTWAYGS